MLMDDENATQSSKLMQEPDLSAPYTDKLDPNLPNDRIDNPDPKCTTSIKEIAEPSRTEP